jgi:hypothetical protein
MASFTATFQFDAKDQEEAEAILGSWTVTPGARLLSLAGVITQVWTPVEVGSSGSVGTALATAIQATKEFTPPPLPPPGVDSIPPDPIPGNFPPEQKEE